MKKWRRKASQAENAAWAMALKCVGIWYTAGIRVCKRLKVDTKAAVASHSPWLPIKRRWTSAKDAEEPLGVLAEKREVRQCDQV